MKAQSRTCYITTMVLVVLGLLALDGRPRRLALLVPAAILVWYETAELMFRNDRN